MRIKVCIPHFFSQVKQTESNLPGGWVPGSARGTLKKREASFAKCLWSLVHAGKQSDYLLLDIRRNQFDRLRQPKQTHEIDITVLTDGKNICEPVLEKYKNYINVLPVDLKDSRDLIFEAREHLLAQSGYDLYLYCEDDIGFTTPDYFPKIEWFAQETNHRSVLMPHRFENPASPDVEKLYIDGPIDQDLLRRFQPPKMDALRLTFGGKEIVFNKPMNPHSATFCITDPQRKTLNSQGVQRKGDFVSNFESVCTLTVLEFFSVLKPDFKYRTFLEVEQHYTNYC